MSIYCAYYVQLSTMYDSNCLCILECFMVLFSLNKVFSLFNKRVLQNIKISGRLEISSFLFTFEDCGQGSVGTLGRVRLGNYNKAWDIR